MPVDANLLFQGGGARGNRQAGIGLSDIVKLANDRKAIQLEEARLADTTRRTSMQAARELEDVRQFDERQALSLDQLGLSKQNFEFQQQQHSDLQAQRATSNAFNNSQLTQQAQLARDRERLARDRMEKQEKGQQIIRLAAARNSSTGEQRQKYTYELNSMLIGPEFADQVASSVSPEAQEKALTAFQADIVACQKEQEGGKVSSRQCDEKRAASVATYFRVLSESGESPETIRAGMAAIKPSVDVALGQAKTTEKVVQKSLGVGGSGAVTDSQRATAANAAASALFPLDEDDAEPKAAANRVATKAASMGLGIPGTRSAANALARMEQSKATEPGFGFFGIPDDEDFARGWFNSAGDGPSVLEQQLTTGFSDLKALVDEGADLADFGLPEGLAVDGQVSMEAMGAFIDSVMTRANLDERIEDELGTRLGREFTRIFSGEAAR